MIHSPELLPEILRLLPLGVTVWHLDEPETSASLRLVEVNAAGEAILGRNADALRGSRIADVFPDAVETKRAALFALVAATGRLTSVEDLVVELAGPESVPRYLHLRLF